MYYLVHFYAIVWNSQSCILRGEWISILEYCFIFANRADPDVGLYCLPKYLFNGIKNEKG